MTISAAFQLHYLNTAFMAKVLDTIKAYDTRRAYCLRLAQRHPRLAQELLQLCALLQSRAISGIIAHFNRDLEQARVDSDSESEDDALSNSARRSYRRRRALGLLFEAENRVEAIVAFARDGVPLPLSHKSTVSMVAWQSWGCVLGLPKPMRADPCAHWETAD